MATKVGDLYYEVTVDTSKMIEGQARAEKSSEALSATLTSTASAARVHAVASGVAATAVREAGRAADAAAVSTGKLGAATDKAAISAKQLTAATRNIPAQFTDIAVSLQAGQNPLTVLLQQGGQLKDMFGGAGAAARAMGTYIVGLINPFTVAAAAIVTFAVGLVKGQAEMSEFNRATTLTGGGARTTADELNGLAARMDGLANVTRGQAAEALGVFVAAGIKGTDSIGKFTEAAIRLEQAGGPAIEKTAETFKDLGKDPLAASLKLNESVNFLTESTYKQIRSLEEQGRHTEAAKVAQNAYADAINQRTPEILENLGFVERSLNVIGAGFRELVDGIKSIGRTASLAEQLKDAQAELDKLQNRKGGWAFGMTQADREKAIADQSAVVESLQEQARLGARAALHRSEEAAQVQALARFDKDGEKFLDKKARMEREITKARQEGREAGLSDLVIEQRIADIRKSYEEKARKPRKKEDVDDAAYLAGLEKRAVDVWTQIGVIEAEAMRDANQKRKDDLISAETHERAKVLIAQAAAKERSDIEAGLDKLIADSLERDDKRELTKDKKKEQGRDLANEAIAKTNPVDAIRFEEEQKIAVMEEYRLLDLENTQLYEDAKAAIRKQANDKVAAYEAGLQSQQLLAYSNFFGGLSDVAKTYAGEQSGVYRGLFAVSKAFSIAQATMSIATGAAKAWELGWPMGIPAAATVMAQGASLMSSIKGANYGGGRQYGGPVTGGSLYRVNETGAPEMFTAANGSQYMLPTTGGNVTPADQVGSGNQQQAWNIIINNAPPGTTATVDQQSRTVEIAVAEVASQISSNSGPVFSALRGATNVQGRM